MTTNGRTEARKIHDSLSMTRCARAGCPLNHPVLPPWLSWVEVRGLWCGSLQSRPARDQEYEWRRSQVLNRAGDAEITVTA